MNLLRRIFCRHDYQPITNNYCLGVHFDRCTKCRKLRRHDRSVLTHVFSIKVEGEVQFLDLETQAMNISISICVTDKGFICTMTISTEDRELCGKLLAHNARNQELDLTFEDGKNPFLPN